MSEGLFALSLMIQNSRYLIVPHLSVICEAHPGVDNSDCRGIDQAGHRGIDRFLVLSRNDLFGQHLPAIVELGASFVDGMRRNSPLELENVKAVAGLDDLADVARPQRLYRLFKNVGKLAVVVARQPASLGIGRVGM